MNNEQIAIGDKVQVVSKELDLNGRGDTLFQRAKVEYIPCDFGDPWIFRNLENDSIHYVFDDCAVTKLGEGGDQ